MILTAYGDPSWGQAMPTPCELRATEDAAHEWRLVPFDSPLMQIDEQDIEGTSFKVEWTSPRGFVVDTDFGLCAVGLQFNGAYRAK